MAFYGNARRNYPGKSSQERRHAEETDVSVKRHYRRIILSLGMKNKQLPLVVKLCEEFLSTVCVKYTHIKPVERYSFTEPITVTHTLPIAITDGGISTSQEGQYCFLKKFNM